MSEVVLYDTGLLVRASTTTLDHSQLSLTLWQKAKGGEVRACIAEQTVWEFFSILTRLRIPHRKVLAETKKHLQVFPLVAPTRDTFGHTFESLQRLRWLTGPQIYDLFLAHTALDNRVKILYTFNDRHFRRFGLPLQVLNPASEHAEAAPRSPRRR